jgi:hypothetical protein
MNTLFLVALVIQGIFAVGFIAAPGAMLGPFGVILNESATVFARLFGSALIAFPILLWFARRSDKWEFRKGAIYAMFAYYLVSTPILTITQTAGLMNVKGWAIVGLHLVFLLWFGVFLVKKD